MIPVERLDPRLLTGDGARKVSILGATALLPRSLRVAARERWLAQHELAKARRAGLLIIGHPKSGNTWLKAMISRLYQVRHGLPQTALIGSDELALRNPAIPRLAATNGHYSYEGLVGRMLEPGGDAELLSRPTVVLVRHPCDIAVSWYFQFTKRQSAAKQELINASIPHPIDRRTIGMWDFVRHSDIGLPSLIDYLNGWEAKLAGMKRGLLVRYEDLRAEPAKWLRAITELMGESFSDEEIEEAVRFGSFDNLRKLETEGTFQGGGMTLRDAKDENSFKVRRAKVGGYRDYFDADQLAELDALVRERLSPTLGYTTDASAPPSEGGNA